MTDLKEAENFYDRLRERVTSEDDLYHRRLSSLISMQAFLFATVGLILRPLSDGGGGRYAILLTGGFILIAAMGVLVALVTERVIREGHIAMDELREQWDKYATRLDDDMRSLFPHPRGYHGRAAQQAQKEWRPWRFTTDHLPRIFLAVWGGFILFAALEALF